MSQLASAKPKRLYRDEADWVLEIERLVPIDDRILRPTTQKLVGEDVVLFQLGNSEDGKALVNDARRLMSEGAGLGASFAVMEGRWVPAEFASQVELPAPRAKRQASPPNEPALIAKSLELAMLRTELKELRAAYERLQRRVGELERGIGAAAPRDPDVPPAAHAEPPQAPPAVEAAPSVPEPAEPAHEPSLKLPPPDALATQIVALTGEKTTMTVAKKPLDLRQHGHLMCSVIDDGDAEVGAMVVNLEATVIKGGRLMLLPDDEIAERLESRSASEEIASAMGEILNVLTAAFNALPGCIHVRTRAIEPVDTTKHGWLTAPHSRLDLGDAQGCVMAFLVKPHEEA